MCLKNNAIMEQRYFIAIIPPEPISSNVLQIKKEFADNYNSKGALRSPAHITLHMPFLWKEEKEAQLIETLAKFTFASQTKILLNNFGHFANRVIFIDVAKNPDLEDMQKQLVRHAKVYLQLFNQDESMRGFHPHMTVAFRDLRKQEFTKAWSEFQNRTFSAEFPLKDFSLLKHDGKQWNVFRTFELNTLTI